MSDKGGVVITGASTGIGAACALGLDKRGYRVFAGVRSKEAGEELVSKAGGGLTPIILDVTNLETIHESAELVESMMGSKHFAGLFNNAGISIGGPLEYVELDDLRNQLEVNVVGQLAVTQAFLPLLRKSKGRIVNTGSVGGFITTPTIGPYCMSKYAMEAFSDALRMELKPQGIEVALLQPAAVATDIWKKADAMTEEMAQKTTPEFTKYYGAFMKGVEKFVEEGKTNAAHPDVVLKAVIHALESRKPKTRYRMGTGVMQRIIMAKLPDRIRDRVFLKALGV